MAEKDIPEEVKNFIYKNIDSLEKLEVLLHFYNKPSLSFNSKAISDEMRSNQYSVEMRIKDLYSLEILTLENNLYQYNRGNKYDNIIRQLHSAYNNYRHTVITLIFSKPLNNIRSFADAFKLKKDEDDD